MRQKRGQTWSLETYLAIGVFLIAVVFFYSLTVYESEDSDVKVQVAQIGKALITGPQLGDGQLSSEDLEYFINLNCSELKELFTTSKEVCIYLRDSDGNLIENETHVIHGIGCSGINISGSLCGQSEEI